jgi:hypothetical protein
MCVLIIIDEPQRLDRVTQKPRLVLGFWPGFGISKTLSAAGVPTWVFNFVIPIAVMLGLSALLGYIVRKVWNADTREIVIALFTGFVVSYVVLTISGTAFRGHGMELFWPWQNPRVPEGANIFLGLFGL